VILDCLDYRRSRWPTTADLHVSVSQHSALETGPVSKVWITNALRGLTATLEQAGFLECQAEETLGGLGLAVTARMVSDILLFRLGGIRHLLDAGLSGSDLVEARNKLLWDPEPTSSWWYLALPAPHSTTPVDMVHTLGSAMAVLGAALLLSRIPVVASLLRPLAAAGAMTLTLYCGHLLVLATGVFDDAPAPLYVTSRFSRGAVVSISAR